MRIRHEQPGDEAGIRRVLESAFMGSLEADLVDRLRQNGRLTISLVADNDGDVVGYVAFSPVRLPEASGQPSGLGLAPMAVDPVHQRTGVGIQLVENGLAAAREMGCDFAVVLGHVDYYPRFGFRPGIGFGLDNEYGVEDEFMVVELTANSLDAHSGLVTFGPEFADFS